jgi:hypothetical protein
VIGDYVWSWGFDWPTYQRNHVCPKCHSPHVRLRWFGAQSFWPAGDEDVGDFTFARPACPEHMKITCTVCGHERYERIIE